MKTQKEFDADMEAFLHPKPVKKVKVRNKMTHLTPKKKKRK